MRRLKAEIERARAAVTRSASPTRFADAMLYFQHELVQTLADGDQSLLVNQAHITREHQARSSSSRRDLDRVRADRRTRAVRRGAAAGFAGRGARGDGRRPARAHGPSGTALQSQRSLARAGGKRSRVPIDGDLRTAHDGSEALSGRRLRGRAAAGQPSCACRDRPRRLRGLLHGPRAAATRPLRGCAPDVRRDHRSEGAGYVTIAAGLAAGEAAESAGDFPAAIGSTSASPIRRRAVTDEYSPVWAAPRSPPGIGPRPRRRSVRVYYEFPLTDAATLAGRSSRAAGSDHATGYKADLGRAQSLFGAKRYDEARAAFSAMQSAADGDDRELVNLRIAECDFYLKRHAAARDGVSRTRRASRKAEARFFYLSALRELGDGDRIRRADPRSSRISPTAPGPRKRSTISAPSTSSRTKTIGGAGVQGALRSLPERAARRARGVEVRLVTRTNRRIRRDHPRVRERGGRVPAFRLSALVSVLVRPRAREARTQHAGGVAAAARLHRLRELVLRPARRASARASRESAAQATAMSGSPRATRRRRSRSSRSRPSR